METTLVPVKTISVLHIEDEEDIFKLTCGMLEPAGIASTWASDIESARRALARGAFDLVLLDHVLPDGNGLSFIEEIWWCHPDIPVIMVSGREDEALAISSVKKGAVNFVLKDEMYRDLIPAIEKILGGRESWRYRSIVTDRLTPWMDPYHPPESENPPGRFLGRAEAFHRRVLSNPGGGCIVVDVDGVITFANEIVEQYLACDARHLLGGSLEEIFDDETAKKLLGIRQRFKLFRVPQSSQVNGWIRREENRGSPVLIPVSISCQSLHASGGGYRACLLTLGQGGDPG